MIEAQLPNALSISTDLTACFGRFGMIGKSFELAENLDVSGFGVSLLWLSPAQVLSEMLESFPGVAVAKLGFLAVGACESGSGDPYFLDLRDGASDPPLVRVPHDLPATPFPVEKIELVTPCFSRFLLDCRIM